ncbi:MAG: hypothetical protein LBR08_03790 [Bacteroidales bacterium]|nr:hypothetical protein [Bacteroidales bacterium]
MCKNLEETELYNRGNAGNGVAVGRDLPNRIIGRHRARRGRLYACP